MKDEQLNKKNTYMNSTDYQSMDYVSKSQFQQDMMKNYMQKYYNDELPKTARVNVLKEQLLIGIIQLPLLTFICTFVFYLLERIVYSKVSVESNLGIALYEKLPNLDFNHLTLVGLFISFIIFLIYYSILNPKITRKQWTRGKFMVIPMSLYCLIIFGDYYLFGIFESLFMKIPDISSYGYLYLDFYIFNYLVCLVAIFTYYFSLAVANSKTLKFEKDLSQRFNLFEKFYSILLIFLVGVPILYYLACSFVFDSSIYSLLKELYIDSNVMNVVMIVAIVVSIINIIKYVVNPNNGVEFKELE